MAKNMLVLVTLMFITLSVNGTKLKDDPTDLWIEVNESYENLLTSIQLLVIDAVEAIMSNLKDLTDMEETILANATATIDEGLFYLLQQVDTIRNESITNGVDAFNCTTGPESRIRRLPQIVYQEIETCVRNSFDRGLELIEESMDLVQNVPIRATNLSNNIHDCELVFDYEGCLHEVLDDVTFAIFSFPLLIDNESNKISQLTTTIDDSLRLCFSNRISWVANQGDDIVDKMAICVEELIISTTLPSTEPSSPEAASGLLHV